MNKQSSSILKKIRPWLGAIYWSIVFEFVVKYMYFFKPKTIKAIPKQENLFQNHHNIVNNKVILRVLQQTFFTNKDTRAGWIGAGVAKTDIEEFKPLVKMAKEHLMMYGTCFKNIKQAPDKPLKVLDLGCGMGYATVCMAENWPAASFDAIDYDKRAIRFARAANKKANIKYYCKDFLDYKTQNRYEYIFIIDVFEHIKPELHDKFIKKALSLLTRNGILFLITPNAVEEEDGDFSHVGLLNKVRLKKFIKNYKGHFLEESFINDEMLSKGESRGLVTNDKLDNFSKYWVKSSQTYNYHIRLVMAKNTRDFHGKNGK